MCGGALRSYVAVTAVCLTWQLESLAEQQRQHGSTKVMCWPRGRMAMAACIRRHAMAALANFAEGTFLSDDRSFSLTSLQKTYGRWSYGKTAKINLMLNAKIKLHKMQ